MSQYFEFLKYFRSMSQLFRKNFIESATLQIIKELVNVACLHEVALSQMYRLDELLISIIKIFVLFRLY